MLKAALRYARLGWYVFPLRTTGDIKAPHHCLGDKDGHKKATTSPQRIREWWGQFPRAGIGLWLAKSKLIAVDADPRDGGDKALAAFESQFGELYTAVVQESGGGGNHYIFAAQEGLAPPGKVRGAKGLDLKYNGYIVLAPSPHPYPNKVLERGQVPTKRYKWVQGAEPWGNTDFLTYAPEWVTEAVDYTRAGGAVAVREDDPFAEDTAQVGLSVEEIANLLGRVPNTGDDELGYDEWLNVLAGIYHETDGSEDGRELAEDWSQQSSKHDSQKFEKSWRSLSIEGKGRQPVTFRYVMKLARENREAESAALKEAFVTDLTNALTLVDFRTVCKAIRTTELDMLDRLDLTGRVQAAFKRITTNGLPVRNARELIRYEEKARSDLPRWLQGWTYCAREDMFFHMSRDEALIPTAFNNRYTVELIPEADRRAGVMVAEHRPQDAALNLYDIPKVYGRMYMPGAGDLFTVNGTQYVNSFSDADMPAAPTTLTNRDHHNIALVERHFKHLVPNERDRELFISWLAYIVQTTKRINWVPVLQGPESDGKTFIYQLMGMVLGARNVKVVGTEVLSSTFTDWAEGSLLAVFEEIKLHGQRRFDVIDKLKPYITNEQVEVHPKGMRSRTVINTTNYMAFTNYRDALPLGQGDSRYFLMASPRQTLEAVKSFQEANPTYYSELFAALAESPGGLRRWLMDWRLHEEFNPNARAPFSVEKAMLTELNKSETQDDIEDLIRSKKNPLISSLLLDSTELQDVLEDAQGAAPQTNGLRHLLMNQLGFTYLGKFRVDGRYRRYWTREPASYRGLSTPALAARIRHVSEYAGL